MYVVSIVDYCRREMTASSFVVVVVVPMMYHTTVLTLDSSLLLPTVEHNHSSRMSGLLMYICSTHKVASSSLRKKSVEVGWVAPPDRS
jgi:hypothetical protein